VKANGGYTGAIQRGYRWAGANPFRRSGQLKPRRPAKKKLIEVALALGPEWIALVAAHSQIGVSLAFHIIFAVISVALPLMMTGVDQAFVPPSTVRFAPVMYEASGLATNATSAATSSTCP
jgi:hypothetical protein